MFQFCHCIVKRFSHVATFYHSEWIHVFIPFPFQFTICDLVNKVKATFLIYKNLMSFTEYSSWKVKSCCYSLLRMIQTYGYCNNFIWVASETYKVVFYFILCHITLNELPLQVHKVLSQMIVTTTFIHWVCEWNVLYGFFFILQVILLADYIFVSAQVEERSESTSKVITFGFGIVIYKCNGCSELFVPYKVRVVSK